MSTRKIKSALNKKGIPFIKIEWIRPDACCESEWFVELTEGTQCDLITLSNGELSRDDFRYPGGNLEDALEWIDCLPSLKGG